MQIFILFNKNLLLFRFMEPAMSRADIAGSFLVWSNLSMELDEFVFNNGIVDFDFKRIANFFAKQISAQG